MKITFKNKKLNTFLKKTSIALCIAGTTSIVCTGTYNVYLDSKLNEIEFNESKIEELKQFYKNKEITIFVMNDSQGVNLNLGFWKNSYPKYLEETLGANVIDASSLRYNKTCHIDMLLEHNVSLEELKKLNNAGAYLAAKTIAEQMNFPDFLQILVGDLGENIFGQKISEQDAYIHISDLLREKENPIFIYSSGANDLMFEIHANPLSLVKYDEQGNITPKFIYAKERMEEEATIKQIMDSIESNWKHILAINPNTKIIALSIYVPHSLQNEEYQDFSQAIQRYNTELKQLCEKYNAIYIDEEQLGTIYNQNDANFHINEVGHKKLASLLINNISSHLEPKKIIYTNCTECESYPYDCLGLEGVYDDLQNEQYQIEYPIENSNDYLYTVYYEQIEEKQLDATTCKTLLKK